MSAAPDVQLHAVDWQPSASRNMLMARARLLRCIREFMHESGVLEVETPALVSAPASDVNIDSFSTRYGARPAAMYLHTSPEYAMKRLLAAGSGPIYQVCKVFRNSESGRLHNPEFTMLEWYRPGFDQHDLMDELNRLLEFLELPAAEKVTYAGIFQQATGLDPHTVCLRDLQHLAREKGLSGETENRSVLLDFIFSQAVLPAAGRTQPLLVHDFPACQAALSRLSGTSPVVAERFELFINGVEIANGFHELTDAVEQRQRFVEDNCQRQRNNKPVSPLDERLLSALEEGIPACSGVALGLDRLLMTMHGYQRIEEVLAFPLEQA